MEELGKRKGRRRIGARTRVSNEEEQGVWGRISYSFIGWNKL